MQNAKDTFYEVLRDRVAAGNAARTVVVRGCVRPAVLVEENELADLAELRDCFRLRWTTLRVDAEGAAALVAMGCEIHYATKGWDRDGSGPQENVLGRGRASAAMDAELLAALDTEPRQAVKRDFAALAKGGVATDTGSRIWWGDVTWGAVTVQGAELQRAVSLTVWSYAAKARTEAGLIDD